MALHAGAAPAASSGATDVSVSATDATDGGQEVADATDTAITWATEAYDTNAMFTAGGSNFTVAAGQDGKYLVTGALHVAASAAGSGKFVYISLRVGVLTRAMMAKVTLNGEVLVIPFAYEGSFSAADAINVAVRQTSGGALDVGGDQYAGGGLKSYISIRKTA